VSPVVQQLSNRHTHGRSVSDGFGFNQQARVVVEEVRAKLGPVRQCQGVACYVMASFSQVPLQALDEELLLPISRLGALLVALLERLVGGFLDRDRSAE